MAINFKKLMHKIKSPNMHYSGFLPENSSPFSSFIRNLIFKRITIDEEKTNIIKKLEEESIVVYVSKYRSLFEFLFYYTRFNKLSLPYPTVGFHYSTTLWQPITHLLKIIYSHTNYFIKNFSFPDPYESGHFAKQLERKKSGIFSLISKKSFNDWFVKSKTDPVEFMISFQKTTSSPVYLIPSLIFYGIKPSTSKHSVMDALFGTQERPGKLRRLGWLFSRSKKSFAEVSQPVSLRNFLDRPDIKGLQSYEQATVLRRELTEIFNRHRQSITGPVLKSRQEIKQSLLTSDHVQNYLKNFASNNNQSIKSVNKKADAYLEEIAANYSSKWIKAFEIVLNWLFKTIFQGIVVDKKNLSIVRDESKKAPLILVPCHKSHLDYLILSYVFYKNNMPCPHIAAGKNLSFWPLGTIFRGGGAFFMRRTFKGAELYSKIFSEYMKKLLTEGFNIELFIEGTRSRTGKLLPPRSGLLSILLSAYFEDAVNDLLFVPVYFGYDRVLEENSYLHEVEGGEKKPESVGQIFKARKFLAKRYGKVYVNFHKPVSLKQYLQDNKIEKHIMDSDELYKFSQGLGYSLINNINEISLATPYGIVASGILNSSKKRFSYDSLFNNLSLYMNYMNSRSGRLSDSLTHDLKYTVDNVLTDFIKRGFVESSHDNEGTFSESTILKINRPKRPALDYYKNNSLNFFLSIALTSISILEIERFDFSYTDIVHTYEFILNLLSREFPFAKNFKVEPNIKKDIKYLIDNNIILPHESKPFQYEMTSKGLKKIKHFSRFLKSLCETYLIVLNTYKRYPKNSYDNKTMQRKVKSIGKKMYKNYEVDCPESLSEISFKNAVRYFTDKGINNDGYDNIISVYSEAIQSYIDHMS